MEEDLRDRVRYEARDGRAYITFCRDEKRNALTYEMFDRLMEHIDTAERDDDVRVIIFKGEGRDFSTGHDLAQVGGAEYGFSKDPKARRPSQRARLHFVEQSHRADLARSESRSKLGPLVGISRSKTSAMTRVQP